MKGKIKEKYFKIQKRRNAKKLILQNFLNVDKESRRGMVAAIQKDNEEKITYIKKAVKRIYELNGVGGPLHIVLDDLNIEDHHILYCLEETIPNYLDNSLSLKEDLELYHICTKCAEYLLELSYTKRKKLLS